MATPKGKAVVTIDLDKHELATVLASLRFFQRGRGGFDHPEWSEHFDKNAKPLSNADIDELCEEINCGEVRL